MIYSCWGSPMTVVADCGLVRINARDEHIQRLVKAVRKDDRAELYYFDSQLKADGGAEEIESAIAAAPQVTLDDLTLRHAIAFVLGPGRFALSQLPTLPTK